MSEDGWWGGIGEPAGSQGRKCHGTSGVEKRSHSCRAAADSACLRLRELFLLLEIGRYGTDAALILPAAAQVDQRQTRVDDVHDVSTTGDSAELAGRPGLRRYDGKGALPVGHTSIATEDVHHCSIICVDRATDIAIPTEAAIVALFDALRPLPDLPLLPRGNAA